MDFDQFDLLGDHILVKDTTTGNAVGTYRLMCSLFTDDFYSETEFHMEDFIKVFGTKLELGCACIHPDYRSGATINLV
ncbi:MAG: GNAT family N-acetyltransferase [Bdellovibrionales bacterium]